MKAIVSLADLLWMFWSFSLIFPWTSSWSGNTYFQWNLVFKIYFCWWEVHGVPLNRAPTSGLILTAAIHSLWQPLAGFVRRAFLHAHCTLPGKQLKNPKHSFKKRHQWTIIGCFPTSVAKQMSWVAFCNTDTFFFISCVVLSPHYSIPGYMKFHRSINWQQYLPVLSSSAYKSCQNHISSF